MKVYIMGCEKKCWYGDKWIWRCSGEDVIIGHSLDGVRYGIDWDDSIDIGKKVLIFGHDRGRNNGYVVDCVVEDKKEMLDLLMDLEI